MQKENAPLYFNISVRFNQYNEYTLIKYRNCYDAPVCLKMQKNISPYFCFRYLYDSGEEYGDSLDQWVSYSDVAEKFRDVYSEEELLKEYERAMSDRKTQQ